MVELRRGFKEDAKRHVLEVRQEIGLDGYSPLNPEILANAYGITVYQINDLELYGCSSKAIQHFADDTRATFSAALLPLGSSRIIIENDNHAPTRRRASVAHELAHLLLEHDFAAAILGPNGCCDVHTVSEFEASWFAGELLIPFLATTMHARRGTSDTEIARVYGVSPRLAAWRMNASGARTIVSRQRARRLSS
jgi:hypothetical protein